MKGKIVNVLLGACACAFVLSAGTAAAVYAGAEEAASPVLTMKAGASVRLFEPTGIRFVTEISAEDYAEIIAADKNAEFGTLIIPTEVLGNTQITAENYKNLDAELIVTETWLADTETTKSYAGALVGTETSDGNYENFPEEFYDCELTAVSYCAYDEKVIFAENPQRYSMAYTASALLAEGQTDPFLTKITDSVLSEGLLFGADSYTLTVGETAETTLVSGGAEVTLRAVYESDNEEAVAVDENGTLTAKAAGSATITATIGKKTAQTAVTVAEKGMVLDFSSAADAPTGGNVSEADWLDSYEGAAGVLKMHVGKWKGYTNTTEWKPIFDSSDYSGYTHLAFRMNVEGFTGNNFKFYYKVEGTGGDTAVQYEIELTADTDGWTTVYRPIGTFVNNFDEYTQKTQLLFLNNPESNDTQTYLYLDSIRAVTEVNYVPGTVNAARSANVNLVPNELAEAETSFTVNDTAVENPASFTVPSVGGRYTVAYRAVLNGNVVFGSYTLHVGTINDATADLLTFDSAASEEGLSTGSGITWDWKDSVDDHNGVLIFTVPGKTVFQDVAGSALLPVFEAADYMNYNAVEIRFKVVGVGGLNPHAQFYYTSSTNQSGEFQGQVENGYYTDGVWLTQTISGDNYNKFIANFTNWLNGSVLRFYTERNMNSVQIYIDSIVAVRQAE